MNHSLCAKQEETWLWNVEGSAQMPEIIHRGGADVFLSISESFFKINKCNVGLENVFFSSSVSKKILYRDHYVVVVVVQNL